MTSYIHINCGVKLVLNEEKNISAYENKGHR